MSDSLSKCSAAKVGEKVFFIEIMVKNFKVVFEGVVVNQDLAVFPPGRDVLGKDGEALHPLG